MADDTAPEHQPAFGTLIARGVGLRCPVCGEGKLFSGLLRMNPNCPSCDFRFERDPGYFLGSTYINYGVTAMICTVAYVTLHFGCGIPHNTLTPFLVGFVVVFPIFFFRYARALWLAADCGFDRTGIPFRDRSG